MAIRGRPMVGAMLVIILAVASPRLVTAATGAVTGSIVVNPFSLTLSLSASSVRVGSKVNAKVRLSDAGPQALINVQVSLRSDPTGLKVSGTIARTVAKFGPNSSTSVAWEICGTKPGNYVLLVSGVARDASGHIFRADSNASVLQVLPGPPRASCR